MTICFSRYRSGYDWRPFISENFHIGRILCQLSFATRIYTGSCHGGCRHGNDSSSKGNRRIVCTHALELNLAHYLLTQISRTVLEPITKDLGVALSAITVNWKRLVSKTVTDTFLGTDESIAYLTTMINENKLLHTEIQAAVDIERSALRALCALYAYIIPYAWSLRGLHPVLVDDGFSCDDVGSGDYKQIFPDDDDKAAACVNNRNHFLLSPEGHLIKCVPWGSKEVRCEELPMSL